MVDRKPPGVGAREGEKTPLVGGREVLGIECAGGGYRN